MPEYWSFVVIFSTSTQLKSLVVTVLLGNGSRILAEDRRFQSMGICNVNDLGYHREMIYLDYCYSY